MVDGIVKLVPRDHILGCIPSINSLFDNLSKKDERPPRRPA